MLGALKVATRAFYIVCSGLLLGAIFSIIFRYQYIHTSGLAVMRIDRLLGMSCYMPCLSKASVTRTPQSASPAFLDVDAAESTANEETKTRSL